MPETRSSARLAGASPESKGLGESTDANAGTKRKAGPSSQSSKHQKKETPKKKQGSIDQSTPADDGAASNEDKQNSRKEAASATNGAHHDSSRGETKGSLGDSKSAIAVSAKREKVIPSNIVEKGIVYFFMRGRVDVEDPESTSDLQRAYFVLRPLPKGAKLTDGPLSDSKHNRLIALPKKTLPKSHSDRFMAFVEKGNTTIQELKENFFQGYTYETKTRGTQSVPPATPIGEGVYAITETERSSHLVYMLTIPSEPGEVQRDIGIRSKGSFIMSVKNPERPGPAFARLPKGPDYPKEFVEEFRGLAWVPVKTKYLDYDNAQILLIGESKKEDLGSAVEPPKEDEKQDKETPLEEVEKLEHEDEIRIHHLHSDDSVYDDLHVSKKDYPDIKTTW